MCFNNGAIQDTLTNDVKQFNDCTEHIITIDRMIAGLQFDLDKALDDPSREFYIRVGILSDRFTEDIRISQSDNAPPNACSFINELINALVHQKAAYEAEREAIGQRWNRVKAILDEE